MTITQRIYHYRMYQGVCIHCGNPFSQRRISAKFCSTKCSNYYNGKNRENAFIENANRNPLIMDADLSYLMGLIATDGCITETEHKVELVSNDDEFLDNVHSIITDHGMKNTPTKYAQKGSNGKHYVSVNRCLYNLCTSLGITQRKSLTIGELSISDEWFAPFFRGCMDGDGTFTKSDYRDGCTTNIVSASKIFIDWLQSSVNRLSGSKGGARYFGRGVHSLRWGSKQTRYIVPWAYRDGKYFLTRKYERVKHLIAKEEDK